MRNTLLSEHNLCVYCGEWNTVDSPVLTGVTTDVQREFGQRDFRYPLFISSQHSSLVKPKQGNFTG